MKNNINSSNRTKIIYNSMIKFNEIDKSDNWTEYLLLFKHLCAIGCNSNHCVDIDFKF